jgi:hypothetical protein
MSTVAVPSKRAERMSFTFVALWTRVRYTALRQETALAPQAKQFLAS